jgi:arginyl-tRNA synthetase
VSGLGTDRRDGTASANLVDRLRAALHSRDSHDRFSVAPLHDAGQSDLAVLVQQIDDLQGSAARISRTLDQRSEVASVRRARQRLLLRLDDAFVADLGAKLEAGATGALANDDLLPGVPYIVDFCDPNATKGLHVGHLRNVALGHALASALELAGARVCRQSVISDSGQQIGEAMAGYARNGNGTTPEASGQKSDHFVGRWYAQYVRENDSGSAGVLSPDLPIARELAERDDMATSLLERRRENEDEVVELWRQIRDWVVTGQSETLARLGVEFDRPIFESSYMPRLAPLIESAVERGIFTYSPSGALVYETGREEYPTLPLARPDGFSTLNLRAILIWHELMPEIPEVTMLHVSGLEWKEHTIHAERILRRLRPELPVQPTHYVLHGMVSTDDGVVSSSTGDVLLVDDLIDDLMTREEVRCLSLEGRPGCGEEDLAVMAALGFSLDRPLSKALCVTPDRVLDPSTSTGSVFARVWSRVWDPASDGEPDPQPNDPVYRFAVVQSQFQRQILSHTLERLDPLASIRHLARLSEWYLAAPSSPSTDRIMRSVLGEGFRGLGLIRADSSEAPARRPAERETAARA